MYKINDYFFCVKGYRDLVQFLCSSMKNNLYLCTQNKNLMAYIITIDSNSNIAKNLIQYIKTFDFVTVTDESTKKAPAKTKAKTGLKKTAFSQEVLEAAEKLKMTPAEIAEAAKKYRMTPDDYALSMVLSDEINGNISQRLREKFNL